MRLIDADKFIEYLGLDDENAREDNIGEIVTLEDFDRQEIIDAEPVKYGEWVRPTEVSEEVCSRCNNAPKMKFGVLPMWCPNCGAKMRGIKQNAPN